MREEKEKDEEAKQWERRSRGIDRETRNERKRNEKLERCKGEGKERKKSQREGNERKDKEWKQWERIERGGKREEEFGEKKKRESYGKI